MGDVWPEDFEDRMEANLEYSVEVELTPREAAIYQQMARDSQMSLQQMIKQAMRLYQLHGERTRAGETQTWSDDERRAKEFIGELNGPDNPRVAALMDAQYVAGAKAGFNAAQADEPNEAIAKLIASRDGYLKVLRNPTPAD